LLKNALHHKTQPCAKQVVDYIVSQIIYIKSRSFYLLLSSRTATLNARILHNNTGFTCDVRSRKPFKVVILRGLNIIEKYRNVVKH